MAFLPLDVKIERTQLISWKFLYYWKYMSTRVFLIKCLDGVIGRMVCAAAFQATARPGADQDHRSFLVIRPGGIGDAVLSIPMLKAMRSLYPSAQIDILAEKRNSAVYSLTDSINYVYNYDNVRDLLTVISSSYDAVIDTEQWHRLSAIVARIASRGPVVGFATNNRSRMLTHAIAYEHDDYEAESFMHLLSPFAKSTNKGTDAPFLNIPDSADIAARRFLGPIDLSRLVAFFPGGSVVEKRWGCDRFVRLGQRLVKKGYKIVVLGGKGDAVCGHAISLANPAILNLCGRLSLVETAAAVKLSALLISGDSGVMHLAEGMGTRIVALFGPSNTRKWTPRSKNVVTLTKNLPCSPCSHFGYMSSCRKPDCLLQITEEDVYESTLKLLETGHGIN